MKTEDLIKNRVDFISKNLLMGNEMDGYSFTLMLLAYPGYKYGQREPFSPKAVLPLFWVLRRNWLIRHHWRASNRWSQYYFRFRIIGSIQNGFEFGGYDEIQMVSDLMLLFINISA